MQDIIFMRVISSCSHLSFWIKLKLFLHDIVQLLWARHNHESFGALRCLVTFVMGFFVSIINLSSATEHGVVPLCCRQIQWGFNTFFGVGCVHTAAVQIWLSYYDIDERTWRRDSDAWFF